MYINRYLALPDHLGYIQCDRGAAWGVAPDRKRMEEKMKAPELPEPSTPYREEQSGDFVFYLIPAATILLILVVGSIYLLLQ